MDKPLIGKNILITRPIDQSKYLSELLKNQGANIFAVPTIEIIADKSNTLEKLIETLDQFHLIIFTSSNAVKHSAKLIKHFWPKLPPKLKIAAIGNSTKNAIEQQAWQCHIVPEINYSSAALLATEELKSITEKNILIMTGKDGLNQLATALQTQQNTVTTAICYQRTIPNYPTSDIIALSKNIFDFIVCTSNDSLKNLSLILGRQTPKKFQDVQILAFSSRINELAKSLGFTKQPIIATPASDSAIVAAIINFTKKGSLMTDKNNEKSNITNAAPQNIDAPKPMALMSIIAIVISVFALVEASYVATRTQELHSTASQSSQQIHLSLTEKTQQLTILKNQMQQLQTNIEKNAQQINAQQTSLESFKTFKFMDNTHWSLAEIKYLLTIAQYNLQLTPSPATALAILEKVNEQLTKLNNPITLPLRQQVVSAIIQLKALPIIDYAGTLMQLNAVSDQLNKMPLFINTSNGTQESSTRTTETTGWRKYWNASLKKLESLVVIRHQNNSAEPLITPKEQMFLAENIQAKLSQASWALLQHNQQVYQQSLQEAINWIQIYYTPNAPATVAVINSLKSLLKINFSLQLPDLTAAISLTDNLLNGTVSSKTNLKGAN